MSEEFSDLEMIYKPNIITGNSSIDTYKLVYKPNENKNEKKDKMKNLKDTFKIILDNDKEYSEDILRIFGKIFVNIIKINVK